MTMNVYGGIMLRTIAKVLVCTGGYWSGINVEGKS